MDSKKIRLLLNTVLILAFLVAFRDFVVLRKKTRTYQQQIQELKDEIAALRQEEDALRQKVYKLESDPMTIEREARNRLNMIKPGEEPIPPDTSAASSQKSNPAPPRR